MFIIGAKTQ